MTRAKDISKILTDADFTGTLDVTGVSTLNSKVGILGTNDLGLGLHIKEGDSGVTSVSTDADQLVIENNAESGISILAPTNSASRIAFGDSDNNKIGMIYYNHSSNFMKFDVNNAERMRINSSGNVGIGTASPSEKLNLVGSSGTSKIRFDGDASNLQNNFIGITGYDDLVIASDEANSGTASTIQFRVDAVERVRIDSSGNVGIGESNPVAKTHIQGSGTSGQTTASLILENSSSGTAGMDITGSAGSSRLRFLYGGGPSTGTNTLTEAMNIVLEGSNAGNVGIGINPQADFHITDASDVRMLFTSDQTGNTSSDGTFLGLTDGGIFNIRNREATNTIFYTNNTERMRITSAGTMTMGTASSLTDVGGITLRKDTQGGYPTLLFLQNQPGTGGTMGADIHMGYASDYGSILRFYGNPFNSRPGGFQFRRVTGSGSSDLSMQIGTDGAVIMPDVYNDTTGSGANVNISSAGQLQRSTSSLRYKNTINDATHGLTELLTLRPVTYKGNNDGDTVFGGLIAEEVHDAGLTEFVQYNDDDEPDALAYGNMVSLCIKAIQELKTELDEAKARIVALETA